MTLKRGARNRGQLLLIAALTFAVILVTLAIILNGAIYAENLGTRSSDTSEGAQRTSSLTFDTIGTILQKANTQHNSSYDTLTRNYTKMSSEFRVAQEETYAIRGDMFNMTATDQTNGTHLRQTNQSRAFTNASESTSDWQVAGAVDGITDYEMVVNKSDLYTDSGVVLSELLSDSFSMHITDETGSTWELHIYENTNNNVAVKPIVDGTEKAACEVDATVVTIDLVAGTVGGVTCSTLTFAEGLDGTVDIEHRTPDKISGTYSLRVDTIINPTTNDHYVEPGTGSPSATPAMYATTTKLEHTGVDFSFVVTRRVIAGELAYAA